MENFTLMKTSREVLGHIIKEETISLLNHHVEKGSLVINIDHPFPGFHGYHFDFTSKPRSIIILTKELYSLAKILRAQKKINSKGSFNINASFAKIKIGKQVYYGIRIKGLTSYDKIPELQKEFMHLGFEILKQKKLKTDKPVSIKISKFFHIVSLENGIYKDKCNDNMYYISIPDYVNWEKFRELTTHVKNNISNNNFDVAKGIFYINDRVSDVLRVYKNNISVELLEEIKERYTKAF